MIGRSEAITTLQARFDAVNTAMLDHLWNASAGYFQNKLSRDLSPIERMAPVRYTVSLSKSVVFACFTCISLVHCFDRLCLCSRARSMSPTDTLLSAPGWTRGRTVGGSGTYHHQQTFGQPIKICRVAKRPTAE